MTEVWTAKPPPVSGLPGFQIGAFQGNAFQMQHPYVWTAATKQAETWTPVAKQ